MSSVIPPAVQDAIERVVERIDRHLAAQSALNYIRCRKNGGSMEECLGIYRLSPPPPGDPFFEELLNNIEVAERHKILTAVKDQLLEEVKRIDRRLQDLDRQNK